MEDRDDAKFGREAGGLAVVEELEFVLLFRMVLLGIRAAIGFFLGSLLLFLPAGKKAPY